MKRILASCFILGAALSTVSHAGRRTYVGVAGGDLFTRVSSSDNYLGTGTGWPADHYSGTSVTDALFALISTGYTWERQTTWLPNYSLGLRFMYVPVTTVSGYIDQYSLPGFRNYNFSYDIALFNLLGTAKIDLVRWHSILPYLIIGAGLANYTTSNYIEKATPNVTPRVSPDFSDGSGSNFTYQLGGGFDFAVRDNMLLSIEFDYANYGTIRTGNGANYTTLTGTNYDNESLRSKIAATSVLLGLTFFTA